MRQSVRDNDMTTSGADSPLEQRSVTFDRQAANARTYVFNLAYRMTGNRTDAEDITQETLLRAWANYGAFDASRSFDAWVLRITANLCIDLYRHRTRCPMISLERTSAGGAGPVFRELADTTHDPARIVLDAEIDERLRLGIQSLSTDYRSCMLLQAQEYTYLEIAHMMGCPLGTIRSRLHRARRHLRLVLSGE
jgi:RNA polymerase sigma-70 factor (ECF subfamily)